MSSRLETAERPETARHIVLRVGELIARETPTELVTWPLLWSLVRDSVDAFFDAVWVFEHDDTPENRGSVNAAVDRLLASWILARTRWEDQRDPAERGTG